MTNYVTISIARDELFNNDDNALGHLVRSRSSKEVQKAILTEMKKVADDLKMHIDRGDLTKTTPDQFFSDQGIVFKQKFDRLISEFTASLPT